MRKIATILMLVAAILVGGMTMDAKTTKKKPKAKTAQTTSAEQWNGDIPPASFLADTFFFGYKFPDNNSIFKKHGYTLIEKFGSVEAASKEGVCEMEVENSAKTIELNIIVYDSSERDWLYNNISSYIKSKGKNSCLFVSKDGNEITFMLSCEW